MPFALLKCLAGAVAKHGVKFVCGIVLPGIDAVYDIASDAYQDYRRGRQEDSLKAEVQALAQAPAEQIRQEVQAAVAAEAAHLSPEVQQKIAAYLTQVPALIRRSLRRSSDPSGTTVPARLALQRPDDLLPFLPPRPPRFQPGQRPLPGVDWILDEPLGIGGFGEVWKAHHAHMQTKAPVALKFCLDPAAARVLKNEAGVLDRVMQHGRHPGIVPLLNTYLSANPPCLEYEYVAGGDLTGLIQELHRKGKRTPAAANRVFLMLVDIVAFAHRGNIVHDDLKPANVLVCRGAGGALALRVTDFGIGGVAAEGAARETRQPTRSRQELLTEAVRGAYTPLYASPEQMLRRPGQAPDPRDDVHALGVIWYQLVTGDLGMLHVPPDWREQLQARGLDNELIDLLGTCVASTAERRPASAGALAKRLRELLGERERPARRSGGALGWIAASVGTALLLALVVWGIVSWSGRKGDDGKKNEADPGKRPPLAVAGMDAQQAKERQVAWANYLGDKYPMEKVVDLGNGVKMEFVLIPPGTFTMGSPDAEIDQILRQDPNAKREWFDADRPQRQVTITKPFYLGKYEVTQAQYQQVMGENPTWFKPGGGGKDQVRSSSPEWKAKHKGFKPGGGGKDQVQGQDTGRFPVENVSWDKARSFCEKMGQQAMLPSEAQWEYACRAGTTTAYSFGDNQASLDRHAWYATNAGKVVHSVGTKSPNQWGLYDMHGNVWEWCQDYYGPYDGLDNTNPVRLNKGLENCRVLRGGSWDSYAWSCRAAYRNWNSPGDVIDYIGIRVALRLD